jgi:hypothetical protein
VTGAHEYCSRPQPPALVQGTAQNKVGFVALVRVQTEPCGHSSPIVPSRLQPFVHSPSGNPLVKQLWPGSQSWLEAQAPPSVLGVHAQASDVKSARAAAFLIRSRD